MHSLPPDLPPGHFMHAVKAEIERLGFRLELECCSFRLFKGDTFLGRMSCEVAKYALRRGPGVLERQVNRLVRSPVPVACL